MANFYTNNAEWERYNDSWHGRNDFARVYIIVPDSGETTIDIQVVAYDDLDKAVEVARTMVEESKELPNAI